MTNEQLAFLQLMKVGLWGERHLSSLEEMCRREHLNWAEIMEIANQQANIGVVTDALTKLPQDLRPSKVIYFNAISQTGEIEKANREMNDFAPVLMGKLREKGVESLLLKGQGVALCYPHPLHRQSGDIDLLVNDEVQFQRGCELMKKISTSSDISKQAAHAEFTAMGFVVELHGKYGFSICKKVTRNLRAWNDLRLKADSQSDNSAEKLRTVNGLILPSVQFDAIFIFAHMLNHFMTGGVGLRQISDWMMFVHAHSGEIDTQLLESDLKMLGLTKFWQAFGAMAVVLLGFPQDKMPLYNKVWDRKAGRLMDSVFKTGNFGALQKAEQLSTDTNKWIKKIHTAFGQLPVYWRVGKVFPKEAIYCFFKYSKAQLM